MLCGIHTFQSLPVELLDPVKNPDDEEDEEEEDEEDDVDVLFEKDEENHPVFPVELAPAIVDAVDIEVWFFWAAATLSIVLSSVLNTDNVPWPRRFGPIIFEDTM